MLMLKLMLRLGIIFVIAGELLLSAQSYPLSEVEIRLARIPHWCGMSNGFQCDRYQVIVRGDGSVEYSGVGRVEGTRTRTISVDDVVSFVNEFLEARFFDARDVLAVRLSSFGTVTPSLSTTPGAPGLGSSYRCGLGTAEKS